MDFGFVAVPAITCIAWFVGLLIKTLGSSEKLDKFIPCICGGVGLILGVIGYLTIPGFIPAQNWIEAVCIGIVSGFAATGIDQIYKQLSKK